MMPLEARTIHNGLLAILSSTSNNDRSSFNFSNLISVSYSIFVAFGILNSERVKTFTGLESTCTSGGRSKNTLKHYKLSTGAPGAVLVSLSLSASLLQSVTYADSERHQAPVESSQLNSQASRVSPFLNLLRSQTHRDEDKRTATSATPKRRCTKPRFADHSRSLSKAFFFALNTTGTGVVPIYGRDLLH